MTDKKPHYIAKVGYNKDGSFLGEVVEEKTGRPAGLSFRTREIEDAVEGAVYGAERLNKYDSRYDDEP